MTEDEFLGSLKDLTGKVAVVTGYVPLLSTKGERSLLTRRQTVVHRELAWRQQSTWQPWVRPYTCAHLTFGRTASACVTPSSTWQESNFPMVR
jgi:hypothetical protein